jgi:hypothetical protein
VREQDAVEPFKAQAALEKLTLRAFAAVYHETILAVHDDLCG